MSGILSRQTGNEEDVRAKIVLPVVTKVLGYSMRHVRLEAPTGSGRADLIVRINESNTLLVECKHPRKAIRAPGSKIAIRRQAERYALELNPDKILLTNGSSFVLIDGHTVVYEAATREQLASTYKEFLTWLHPAPAYGRATGLILPDELVSPAAHLAMRQARRGPVDVRAVEDELNHDLSIDTATRQRVIEEVAKYNAVHENRNRMRLLDANPLLFVVHIDETFCDYHDGAWEYDHAYCQSLAAEEDLSRAAGQSNTPVFFRLFILRELIDVGRLSDIIRPLGLHLLSSNYWIAFAGQATVAGFGLKGGDLVGESHILMYEDLSRFSYSMRQDTAGTSDIRDRIREFMKAHAELVFPAGATERFDKFVTQIGREWSATM